MRILIISQELWTTKNNGGNVLSNLFEGFDAEFAQIYCSPGMPENNVCKNYYQITDMMMIKHFFRKEKIGLKKTFVEYPKHNLQNIENSSNENSFYSFFKRHHWLIFDILREVLWKFSNWNSKDLELFIKEFNPDVVFAPCYGSHYMLSMTRYIAGKTDAKIISYISDDHYSFRQFRLSPLYWLYRFSLRKSLKKTFRKYSLTYTMTEEQKQELTNALGANMKILRKGGDNKEIIDKNSVGKPIRLIYAGNLCCGRMETLSHISEVLKEINKTNVEIELNVYTNSIITDDIKTKLNDNKSSFLYAAVSQYTLKQLYNKSDIMLHVEAFSLKYKLLTRLSFSTKIVDCLASGCAVLCISWNGHSGYKYLRNEDAAICIDNLENVKSILVNLINNKEIILEYRQKALNCLKKNHDIQYIRQDLFNDFKKFSKNN